MAVTADSKVVISRCGLLDDQIGKSPSFVLDGPRSSSTSPASISRSDLCDITGTKTAETQAKSIWEMLDNLSQNDSKGYKRLLESVGVNDGVADQFVPDPGFVIQTTLEEVDVTTRLDSDGKKLFDYFVNVCSSDKARLPFNRSTNRPAHTHVDLDSSRVPISVGCRRETKGGRVITDVVVHTLALSRCKSDISFKQFLSMLVLDLIEFREQQHNNNGHPNSCSAISPVDKTFGQGLQKIRFRRKGIEFPKLKYKCGAQPKPHSLQRDCQQPKTAGDAAIVSTTPSVTSYSSSETSPPPAAQQFDVQITAPTSDTFLSEVATTHRTRRREQNQHNNNMHDNNNNRLCMSDDPMTQGYNNTTTTKTSIDSNKTTKHIIFYRYVKNNEKRMCEGTYTTTSDTSDSSAAVPAGIEHTTSDTSDSSAAVPADKMPEEVQEIVVYKTNSGGVQVDLRVASNCSADKHYFEAVQRTHSQTGSSGGTSRHLLEVLLLFAPMSNNKLVIPIPNAIIATDGKVSPGEWNRHTCTLTFTSTETLRC
eukprot:GHVS01057311.1.p1 GENE.GHVS01057311.1~~GHVS01057311.1.p1  ORF type:complete len:536 (-),score=125.90 GHVS01057311.1:94-1701(-)